MAQERLQLQSDGRIRLGFKAPWADGTNAVLFIPLDFIARLCAAIPPPRFHMLRFHGVLAPHSTLRSKVVPKSLTAAVTAPSQLPLPFAPPSLHCPDLLGQQSEPNQHYEGRHRWAVLLRHVFAADVTVCAHCQGRMGLRQLCTTPDTIADALAQAGLQPRAPPVSRPLRSAQLSLSLYQTLLPVA